MGSGKYRWPFLREEIAFIPNRAGFIPLNFSAFWIARSRTEFVSNNGRCTGTLFSVTKKDSKANGFVYLEDILIATETFDEHV